MSNLSNLSKVELGTGAMLKPSPETKVDNFQSSKWKGNYHLKCKDTGIIFESFESIFERIERLIIPLCDKYIFGEEYGDNKETPHIEFAFTIKGGKRLRRDKLLKLFNHPKHMYLDKMKGNLDQQSYCAKEGNKVITNIKFAKPLKLIEKLYPWQKEIVELVKTEPDDRTIVWRWDKNGNTGKTSFCKYLCAKHDAIMLNGKSADMMNCIVDYMKNNNGATPELILVNLPRSFNNDYLSYPGLESIKDMCFYSGKYEGGQVVGNSPHLIIFANEPPVYSKLSKDRWNVKNIEEDNDSDNDEDLEPVLKN